jgi:hypothetical protein
MSAAMSPEFQWRTCIQLDVNASVAAPVKIESENGSGLTDRAVKRRAADELGRLAEM